jgi:aminoglycoside 6'-N-acetyltransferase
MRNNRSTEALIADGNSKAAAFGSATGASTVTRVELRGERVVLRPLEERDIATLLEFVHEPDVARWWPRVSDETLRENLGTAFAIEHAGELVGYAEVWEEDEPEYRHAGMDLFLGTTFHGRGLGGDAVLALARHLVHDRGHHRLVIDPAAENERAIRAYERVGFQRVGIQRKSELAGDGTWRDGLLMDLLADELH